jgi:hypothetical protein
MKMQDESFEVRAMLLIVLPVSALLLLWAWAGAFVLLNPDTVEPALRLGGLPMLIIFGGLFVWSLVGLFNCRIRVDPHEITILLSHGGSVAYGRDELDLSIKHRIIRLKPVAGAKLGWRRLVTPDRWINTYLVISRKEGDQGNQ